MANLPAVEFQAVIYGDGVSTTATVDLLTDPVLNAGNVLMLNKFTLNHTLPTSIVMLGSTTAVLSGSTVTFTFASAPTGPTTATGYFLF